VPFDRVLAQQKTEARTRLFVEFHGIAEHVSKRRVCQVTVRVDGELGYFAAFDDDAFVAKR
jgi:hypothetical protein